MQEEELNQFKSPRARAYVDKTMAQSRGLELADFKILGMVLLVVFLAMHPIYFIWFNFRLYLKMPQLIAEHPYISFYAFFVLIGYGILKLTPVYLRRRRRQINQNRQGGPAS